MFVKLASSAVTYDQYLTLMPPDFTEELLATAKGLKHLRVVHLNSTPSAAVLQRYYSPWCP